MTKPDLSTLGTGTSVLVLGAFLLLQANGTLELNGAASVGVLAGCVVLTLVTSAVGRRVSRRGVGPDEEDLASAALGREASRVSKVGFAVGVVLGAALFFLWANGSLESAGNVALAALVVTIALILISAPLWLVDGEATQRGASRPRSLARARRGGCPPARLGPPDARAGAEARRRAGGGREARPQAGAGAALVARRTTGRAGPASASPTRSGRSPSRSRSSTAPRSRPSSSATRRSTRGSRPSSAPRGGTHQRGQVRLRRRPGQALRRDRGEAGQVFVDDRGPDFDPEAISQDRRGIRESIIGRMERHGGRAEIRSEPAREPRSSSPWTWWPDERDPDRRDRR